jgi:hypothetical protein
MCRHESQQITRGEHGLELAGTGIDVTCECDNNTHSDIDDRGDGTCLRRLLYT